MNFIVCCCVRGCEKLDRCASGIVVFKPATEDNLMHLTYDYISMAVAFFSQCLLPYTSSHTTTYAESPSVHFITYYNIRSVSFRTLHHILQHTQRLLPYTSSHTKTYAIPAAASIFEVLSSLHIMLCTVYCTCVCFGLRFPPFVFIAFCI